MGDDNRARLPRTEQRNIMHPDLRAVLAKIKSERKSAEDRYDSARVILESHTLWKHQDGRDICDCDGEKWPCNTLGALGFIYGVRISGW